MNVRQDGGDETLRASGRYVLLARLGPGKVSGRR